MLGTCAICCATAPLAQTQKSTTHVKVKKMARWKWTERYFAQFRATFTSFREKYEYGKMGKSKLLCCSAQDTILIMLLAQDLIPIMLLRSRHNTNHVAQLKTQYQLILFSSRQYRLCCSAVNICNTDYTAQLKTQS